MEPVTRDADVTSNMTLHSSEWSGRLGPRSLRYESLLFLSYRTASLPCYILLELDGALFKPKMHLE